MLALHIPLDVPYQRGLSNFRLYLNKSDYIFSCKHKVVKNILWLLLWKCLQADLLLSRGQGDVTVTFKHSAAELACQWEQTWPQGEVGCLSLATTATTVTP